TVDCANPEASTEERMIPAEHFPYQAFAVERGEAYKKQVVIYHIPFTGDMQLLRFAPSPREMNAHQVYVQDGAICFEVIAFYEDPTRIKSEADGIIRLIRDQSVRL